MKKIAISIVVLLLILAAGYKMFQNHKNINSTQNLNSGISSVVSVKAFVVKPMKLEQKLSFVGTLKPNSEINIVSESQGKLTSVSFELGQHVNTGNVIATIDNKLKELAVRSAQVSLAKQKKELARTENLFKGGGATQQQLEDARTSVENATITLEQNQKQLSDATIKAPISGTITKKYVNNGAFVNIGTSIATIVDVSRLKLKLNVSESDVYKIKNGDNAQITTDIYENSTFNGKVTFISTQGDENHNYDVEIQVINSGKNQLKAGTFANATINRPDGTNKIYIPRNALQGSIRESQVFVAQNGKAILKSIRVAEANNDYLEVLGGLSEGEQVITSGQINLENGKAIKVITE